MSTSARLILASGDITNSPVFAGKLRGKAAKEVYRCAKGILVTRSVSKPLGYAVATIPGELTKGFVYTAVGQVGESAIGYISGVGFVRFLYKVAQPSRLKATLRLAYNVGCLPLTLYSKGIGGAFDLLQISKLEEMWFGSPVYIFNDNRLWVEANFTMSDVFDQIKES